MLFHNILDGKVTFRYPARLYAHAHPQVIVIDQDLQLLSQCVAVFYWNQESVDAILHGIPATHGIGGDDGTSHGVGFNERLRQSFAIVAWQYDYRGFGEKSLDIIALTEPLDVLAIAI